MNLGEIRTFVNNILDYSPSVQAYTDEVNNVINEIYLSHFTDRLWEYSQKQVKLSVYQDVEGVAFTAQADGSLLTTAGFTADWISWGHIAEITAASNPGGNVVIGDEYHISYREDIGGQTRIHLEEMSKQGYASQYGAKDRALTISAGHTFTIKFKQRQITLPEDCVELIGLGLRERGSGIRSPFDVLPRWYDENLALDLDLVALPTDVIMEQPFSMMAPVNDPTLSVRAAAANTVSITGDYEVAYTIIHRSRAKDTIVELESAPKKSTLSYAFTAGNTIEARNLERTDDNPRSAYQEYLKRVYLKMPNSKHFFRCTDLPTAEWLTTEDNAGTGLLAFEFAHKTEARLPENGGTYQRCRLYPRQDKNYEATFRYQYRPIILRDDNDTPQMPADTHRYIAYRACQELFMKHGNTLQSQAYQIKADKELLKIENRYLRTKGATHIKGPYRATGALMGRPQVTIKRN